MNSHVLLFLLPCSLLLGPCVSGAVDVFIAHSVSSDEASNVLGQRLVIKGLAALAAALGESWSWGRAGQKTASNRG